MHAGVPVMVGVQLLGLVSSSDISFIVIDRLLMNRCFPNDPLVFVFMFVATRVFVCASVSSAAHQPHMFSCYPEPAL